MANAKTINITLLQNNNVTYGFECLNHGRDIVCSAVSMLTINTINSIETLSGLDFNTDIELELNEKRGYIKFVIKNIEKSDIAKTLMKSFEIGAISLNESYNRDVKLLKRKEG